MSTVQGAGVVVTGAGGGIGAALARRFAAEGARVVVNDLKADRVEALAEEIGGTVVAGDASTVVDAAREALGGTVDVYCANAGLASGGDAFAEEDVWAAAWDVNVMAHVRAARALLPEWLERGSGRFVSTASAAGLLTMIGAAPYSVSKHGAVAFAEWLSLTYRHRGIKVHTICPQGCERTCSRPPDRRATSSSPPPRSNRKRSAGALFEAMEQDRFLVLPHPEVVGYYRARAKDPDHWIGSMNHLQRKWEEAGA